MPVRSKFLVIALGLTFLFLWANPVIGSSIDQLEKLADSDFIPEVREAASSALAKKYIDENTSSIELIEIAETATTDQLETAVIKALARQYKDAKGVESLEEALKKAEQLEEKVREGEPPAIRRAASSALGLYYLSFNLNDLKGYSMENLENIIVEAKVAGLREAAATALESIYPNHYSAEELTALINSSTNETIKKAAAGALTIRYSEQMPPNLELEKLQEIASDLDESHWVREAAGRAFGALAPEHLSSEQVKELALSGATAEIRAGAAEAWARKLIHSDKTQEELLRMVCAATGFAPFPYRSAITTALAERMFKSGLSI